MFRAVALLGGLSATSDLGSGAPVEESLRRCLLGTRLARAVGCGDDVVRDVLWVSLLQHLGCTAYAHEAARTWGDDVLTTRLAFLTDFTDPRDVWRTWVTGAAESSGRSRTRTVAVTVATAGREDRRAMAATCEVAEHAARRLGCRESVQQGLAHVLARWDGKGQPAVGGEAIPLATRLAQVASVAVLFTLHAGAHAAAEQVGRRSGTYLDPQAARAYGDLAPALTADLEDVDALQAVLDAEPDPVRYVTDEQVREVVRTFGDLVDLKSPWLHGHSAAVADLAAAAAGHLVAPEDVVPVRLAGHLQDVGRVTVSSRIWGRPGRLSEAERGQVRLHAYHSERVLVGVPGLERAAALAGRHHERCDGSGYHRGDDGTRLSPAARVLAAADVLCALTEPRPHRPACTAAHAAGVLRQEVGEGRLDRAATEAVLRAAGLPSPRAGSTGDVLTRRQVEVLRLLAGGLSNRGIAERLGISPRTAEHHVQDLYSRIGRSTRAGAALYAMEHGLVAGPG